MQAVFTMITQAASTVSRTMSAVEKFAGAAENVGKWAEDSTASFSDEAAHKRKINNELQRQEFELLVKERQAKIEAIKGSKAKAIAA